MKHAVLVRLYSSLQGTPGLLYVKKDGWMQEFCKTIELPWMNNEIGKSCIPAGEYYCDFTMSPRYRRKMYLLRPTVPRTGIRIHSANFAGDMGSGYARDLLGCIALGTGHIGGPGTGRQLMLTNSRVTMRKFEKLLNGETFKLTIIGDFSCQDSWDF